MNRSTYENLTADEMKLNYTPYAADARSLKGNSIEELKAAWQTMEHK